MHPSQNVLLCPNSCVVFFPEEIYKSVGSSDVLPQLLEVVAIDKLCAAQFLRNGAVRLTFKQTADCEELVARGLTYGDTPLRVASADARSRIVYLRDCPPEVPNDVVLQFFSSYGVVHSVKRSKHAAFPVLHDGNRVVRMSLSKDIPSAVYVAGFDCRVWYARQPPQCSICNKSGHRNRDCPLSGLCRRCRQPGHRAKECRQAWGPTQSAVPVDERTEVLISDPVPDRDDSPDFVSPDEEASVSADECEMASGDEAVVAEAASPPSPRRPSSKPIQAPASRASVPAAAAKPVSEPVQAPVSSVSEPSQARSSEPRPSRLAQWHQFATKNTDARTVLKRHGHFITEELLERISPHLPVNSCGFQTQLSRLIKERLESDDTQPKSLLAQLYAVSRKDPYLFEELKRRGHVVTNDLLKRIPDEFPIGSNEYIYRLTDLIDEAIGFKDTSRPRLPKFR